MSAVLASPAAKESEMDSVRALQHALYRAAKADPGRRFHSLWDKILRRDVLERAWEDVRRNGGAAGIDRVSVTDVEEYGVSRLLDEVTAAVVVGADQTTSRSVPNARIRDCCSAVRVFGCCASRRASSASAAVSAVSAFSHAVSRPLATRRFSASTAR